MLNCFKNTVFIVTIVTKKIEENGQPHSTVIINVKNYLEKLQYAQNDSKCLYTQKTDDSCVKVKGYIGNYIFVFNLQTFPLQSGAVQRQDKGQFAYISSAFPDQGRKFSNSLYKASKIFTPKNTDTEANQNKSPSK